MNKKCRFLSGAAAAALMISVFSFSKTEISADVTSVKGDLNGDGYVDVMDRIYLKKHLINDSMSFPVTNWRKAADFNGDLSIDFRDLNSMRDYVLGCGNTFTEPEAISTYDGIDVSRWQGDINWEQVRAAGIDFVMIKAGEGTEIEKCFLNNIAGAKKAGIQCGIYWFANARSVQDAHTEAAACLEVISRYQLEYPVVYDFEYRTLDGNNPLAYDRAKCTEAINAFLGDIESAGWFAMVYTNKDFPQRYLNINDITSRYALWYANYSISRPDTPCTIWQYSCTGRVDGINADVDLDISYFDFKSRIVSLGLNGYKKPESSTGEKDPEQSGDKEQDPSGSDHKKPDISEIVNDTDFWNGDGLKETGSGEGVRIYQGENYGIMITVKADEKTGKVMSAEALWGENESEMIKNDDLYNSVLRNDIQRILSCICGYEKSEAISFLKSQDLSDDAEFSGLKTEKLKLTHDSNIRLQIEIN